jgi:hypothetical protein
MIVETHGAAVHQTAAPFVFLHIPTGIKPGNSGDGTAGLTGVCDYVRCRNSAMSFLPKAAPG